LSITAIVDHRCFAAIADPDTVGLTQFAVSLHIKILEKAVLTTLTEQGREQASKTQKIIALCDDLTILIRK